VLLRFEMRYTRWRVQPEPSNDRARSALLAANGTLLAGLDAVGFLRCLLSMPRIFGRSAVVSSFGIESAVLLHHVSEIAPDTPVIFIDTRLHFEETLAFKEQLVNHLRLSDVRSFSIDPLSQKREDPKQRLHLTNPDRCCHVRKVEVLTRALRGFDGWITGQKRHQSATRAELGRVEWDAERNKAKFNLLSDWSAESLVAYADRYDLPRHPLLEKGYASVGCAPCTTPVAESEDPRAGRWRGLEKRECGLLRNPHIIAASSA